MMTAIAMRVSKNYAVKPCPVPRSENISVLYALALKHFGLSLRYFDLRSLRHQKSPILIHRLLL